MKDLHYFLIFLVSFLVTVWINYHNNSVKIQKLVLRWEEKCFHIHHWLTFSGILLAFVLGRYLSLAHFNIGVVILLGIIAEDFLFKDVFSFCKPCEELLR